MVIKRKPATSYCSDCGARETMKTKHSRECSVYLDQLEAQALLDAGVRSAVPALLNDLRNAGWGRVDDEEGQSAHDLMEALENK